MFLPMSWTSPLTVAMTIRPACSRGLPVFSASRNGSSQATACFITRADLTTCGRNILPEPNRSPTTFIPSINGPSMTCSGRSAAWRASSVSASIQSVMPCTSACSMRLATGASRQLRSMTRSAALSPLYFGASSTSRSVFDTLVRGGRFRITSSTASLSSASMSS